MNTTNPKTKEGELPKVNEVETISPATRLLNKRRQMYENQEAYKQKKKEYQASEVGFRVQEKELRDCDQEIQESLITFANYLDANQKAMQKADENILKYKQDNEAKQKEIEKKIMQGEILRDKAKRIERQKNAVEKYEQFLKMVMNKSGGEYTAIEEIVKRFETLTATHKELT